MSSRTLITLTFLISIIPASNAFTAEVEMNTSSDEEHSSQNSDYININHTKLKGPTKKLYDYITNTYEKTISPNVITFFEKQGANTSFAFSAAINIAIWGINKYPAEPQERIRCRITKCAQYDDPLIQYAMLRTLVCKSINRSLDAMKILLTHNDIKKIDPSSSLLFETLSNYGDFGSGPEALDFLAKKGANVNAIKDGLTLYQAILKAFQPDQHDPSLANYLTHRQNFCNVLFNNGYELKWCDIADITEATSHDMHSLQLFN